MSFESEALAHDELSLLDLFGPDASPRAQNIVQAAAERSMDEMAEVINAGNNDAFTDAVTISAPRLGAFTDLRGAIAETVASSADSNRKDLSHYVPGVGAIVRAWRLMTPLPPVKVEIQSDTWDSLFPSKYLLGDALQVDEVIHSLLDGHSPISRAMEIGQLGYKPVISQGLRSGAGSRAELFARVARDEELKDSLVHQLTEQLNAAIARGVDLSKVSVVLNAPNPESQRVEPVCIYADAATHMPRPLIIKQPRKAASKKY